MVTLQFKLNLTYILHLISVYVKYILHNAGLFSYPNFWIFEKRNLAVGATSWSWFSHKNVESG